MTTGASFGGSGSAQVPVLALPPAPVAAERLVAVRDQQAQPS
ncbi:hypothetical protein FORC44_3032 [Escherichia coli]|nr:hypothetical protein FORC44_3032 [Escherichia coli]